MKPRCVESFFQISRLTSRAAVHIGKVRFDLFKDLGDRVVPAQNTSPVSLYSLLDFGMTKMENHR
ncbi:MAG: hypothetical protein ACR2GR_02555 [Rhodothermales bacterium]